MSNNISNHAHFDEKFDKQYLSFKFINLFSEKAYDGENELNCHNVVAVWINNIYSSLPLRSKAGLPTKTFKSATLGASSRS